MPFIRGPARPLVYGAESNKSKTQVLVTTHSPYFVDALAPEQVWLIEKGDDGFAKVMRTAEIPNVREMIDERIPLGSLWYSQHFGRLSES